MQNKNLGWKDTVKIREKQCAYADPLQETDQNVLFISLLSY
jgi:hypothetical protein